MYRFLLKPKWIAFTLVVALAAFGMVQLGLWQKHRHDDRSAFNEQVRANEAAPVVPLADLDVSDPEAVDWRRVSVSGTYLPGEQFEVVNRSQGGFPGRNIVDVLDLGDGTAVLVNRGFLPSLDPAVATPTGPIEVVGRLRTSEERRLGQPTMVAGDEPFTQVPRIEIDQIQPQVEPTLAPVFIERIESTPADAPSLAPIAFPGLDGGPHLSYMVQWWIFAACVVIGWVFAVRRTARERAAPIPPSGITPDGAQLADRAPTTEPIGTDATSSH